MGCCKDVDIEIMKTAKSSPQLEAVFMGVNFFKLTALAGSPVCNEGAAGLQWNAGCGRVVIIEISTKLL